MRLCFQKGYLGKKYDRPRALMNAWLISTLVCFAIGPLVYSNCNKWLSIIFMIVFLIVANLFYSAGTHNISIRPYARYKMPISTEKLIKYVVWYSFIITIAYFVESMMHYGFTGFSLLNFFSRMAETYSQEDSYTFMISAWILSYTKWLRIIGLVLGSLFWKRLSFGNKALYVATVTIIVVHNTVYTGSQKELIDTVIYVFMPMLMRWWEKSNRMALSKKIILILAIFVALLFMGTVINSRHLLWTKLYNSQSSLQIDKNNWLYILLPDNIADSFCYIFSYLTQGYRGLALCLTLPFKWAYGMGSSFKLMNDVSRWFSIPITSLEVSYPIRMEEVYGVGAYSSWHSIFPWFASDFTWIGAILVVGLFVYYWAKAWTEYVKKGTWISAVLFVHLFILVLYIPCNNQLFQTRDSIVATLVLFLFWYLFHGAEMESERSE